MRCVTNELKRHRNIPFHGQHSFNLWHKCGIKSSFLWVSRRKSCVNLFLALLKHGGLIEHSEAVNLALYSLEMIKKETFKLVRIKETCSWTHFCTGIESVSFNYTHGTAYCIAHLVPYISSWSSHLIRFGGFTEMNMHIVVYLTMTTCSLVDSYGHSTAILLPWIPRQTLHPTACTRLP